jgi:hypothetical protein
MFVNHYFLRFPAERQVTVHPAASFAEQWETSVVFSTSKNGG